MILVILLLGSFFYIRSRFANIPEPVTLSELASRSASSSAQTGEILSDKIRIQILEQSVQLLAQQINKTNSALKSNPNGEALNTTSPTTETRLRTLETAVNNLQSQINALKTSTPTQSSSSKTPAYIPLGSGGNTNDRSYINASGYEVQINPSNYAGYTSMQLEVNVYMNESVGTANIRLYNSTDGSAVSGASVSTTSTKSVLLGSGTFTLPAGSKTYNLQVQSTEGYQVNLQNARIKVNF